MRTIQGRIDSIDVSVQSPDGNISASFRSRDQVHIKFSQPYIYDQFDLDALEYQLAKVLTLLAVSRMRSYHEILRAEGFVIHDDTTPHWNLRTRALLQKRTEVEAEGLSIGEYIRIDTVGLLSYRVHISDDTKQELDEYQFAEEFCSAATDLIADFAEGMKILKEEIYEYPSGE